MDKNIIISYPPTADSIKKTRADRRTGTTGTVGTVAVDSLEVVALLCLIAYLIVGIIIGMVIVWSLSFPLQLIAMGSYVVFGAMGMLPWQIAGALRKEERC